MAKLIAGEMEYDSGWITAEASISYKPQHVNAEHDLKVREWLDAELGHSWRSGEFQVNVVRTLGVEKLLEKNKEYKKMLKQEQKVFQSVEKLLN